MYHSFLIHLFPNGHLGCIHVLAKQYCDEHWGTRVSFNSGFLGVYAQQSSILKSTDITWLTKAHVVKATGFPVVM